MVAHFLQTVGNERGATAAAAITDDALIEIGHLVFDLQLNDTAVEVACATGVAGLPLITGADVNQDRGAAADFMRGVVRRNLFDVLLRFGNELFGNDLVVS